MTTYDETYIAAVLKQTDPPTDYPADLLAAQRARFVAQISAAGPVWGGTAWEAGEPDEVDEQTDERNSRPFPF
jgi:hypothetical protein